MKSLLQLFFLICYFSSFGQKDTNWYAFYNSDSSKIGFKDVYGSVKIEPKYEPHFTEQVFKNVIIVSEKISEKEWKTFYINKKGKKFGNDSIYIFDFEYANESDKKIRFRDRKTDKVGFFDIDGKVVIPAMYNDAGNFHNGIAIIIKDATRKCWKEDNGNEPEYPNCEHWSWQGKTMMINEKNQQLFEIPDRKDFSYSIDYSNFKINEKIDNDIYTSYKGSDGNVYSFYSPEKDFNKWFDFVFIPDFKKNKTVLPKYFYELISVDDNDNPKEQTAWKNHKKEEYLKKNIIKINHIFDGLTKGKFQKNSSWEMISNHLYYPQNELPKVDLTKNTIISFYCNAENDFTSQISFQFMKIDNSFYIISGP